MAAAPKPSRKTGPGGTPGDEPSDRDLIAEANAGEAAALEALYLRYRDWVASRARRFCGNDDDALDVMQETFLYLFGKFPGFTLTCKMTTFLYPVVRNLSLARIKMRRRHEPITPDAAETLLFETPAAQDSDEELAKLVAGLPAAQQEVLMLRYGDEMSLSEIADALAIPLGTVKSRLNSGLQSLRGRWGGKYPD